KKKKKKYKSVITRRIFKSIDKIGICVLVASFFAGIVVMRGTNAGFLDEEKSEGNGFSMGTLISSVISSADFSPKVSPSKEATRLAVFSNGGTINLKYRVTVENISGNICDKLEIKDDLDDNYKALSSYISSTTDNLAKTNWKFTTKLTDNDESLADKTCNFDLKFESWQSSLAYGAGGFTDTETLSSKIESEHWTNIADHLVVNEVYYDVDGSHGTEPDNEWVELYNPTSSAVNLKNWKLCDNHGCSTISTSDLDIIPANGYAVVTKDVSTWGHWTIPGNAVEIVLGVDIGNGLANDGDRVILRDSSDKEIDAMSYGSDATALNPACSDVAEGHSLARKPAGKDLNIKDDFENLSSPNPGTNPHTVVMNEIMPDPIGEDDAKMSGGEWIELYNYGEYSIDLKDWTLKDKGGNTLKIKDNNTSSGSTVISGGERLVVYRNGDEDFDLKDSGDEVQLIDEKGLIKDSHAFSETTPGKSIARFPDAVGPWIDPQATPGEENKLLDKELDGFKLLTYGKCFNEEGNLEKNSKEEICTPVFLEYVGMIKEIGDKKIKNSALMDILEMKKEEEKKKLDKMLKETEKMLGEQNVLTGDKIPPVILDSVKENPASEEFIGADKVGAETVGDDSVKNDSSGDADKKDILKAETGIENKKEEPDNTITNETNEQI
ncbi:MAG: lamin tail domain-containing protein, partial [Parcubacteria group bacterium]